MLSTRDDRALVTHLGAIADLAYEDLPPEPFRGFAHLHLTSYFLQHGLRPSFARLVREAKRAGLTVSFDPNSDPAQTWSPEIWEVMELADVVFVNESEALALTGKQDMRAALSVLGERTSCAVVKQGRHGASVVRDTENVHAEAFPIDVADTTGAGDSCAAGFVHGLLTGRTLRDCLLMANAAGALSAMHIGGTAGQPDNRQLEAFLQTHESRAAEYSA